MLVKSSAAEYGFGIDEDGFVRSAGALITADELDKGGPGPGRHKGGGGGMADRGGRKARAKGAGKFKFSTPKSREAAGKMHGHLGTSRFGSEAKVKPPPKKFAGAYKKPKRISSKRRTVKSFYTSAEKAMATSAAGAQPAAARMGTRQSGRNLLEQRLVLLIGRARPVVAPVSEHQLAQAP